MRDLGIKPEPGEVLMAIDGHPGMMLSYAEVKRMMINRSVKMKKSSKMKRVKMNTGMEIVRMNVGATVVKMHLQKNAMNQIDLEMAKMMVRNLICYWTASRMSGRQLRNTCPPHKGEWGYRNTWA